MAKKLKLPPVPQQEERRTFTVQINKALFDEFHAKAKKTKRSMRSLIEYGIRQALDAEE